MTHPATERQLSFWRRASTLSDRQIFASWMLAIAIVPFVEAAEDGLLPRLGLTLLGAGAGAIGAARFTMSFDTGWTRRFIEVGSALILGMGFAYLMTGLPVTEIVFVACMFAAVSPLLWMGQRWWSHRRRS